MTTDPTEQNRGRRRRYPEDRQTETRGLELGGHSYGTRKLEISKTLKIIYSPLAKEIDTLTSKIILSPRPRQPKNRWEGERGGEESVEMDSSE
jgi:hypothetical protein